MLQQRNGSYQSMNKEQAIHKFWNSFGISAYDENTVPDGLEFPYITYSVSTDSLGNALTLYANIWDRSTSWERATLKAEEIAQFIGYGHHLESFNGGYVYITKGTPFAQRMSEPGDDMVRRIYINVEAEFLCEY